MLNAYSSLKSFCVVVADVTLRGLTAWRQVPVPRWGRAQRRLRAVEDWLFFAQPQGLAPNC